MASSSAPSGGSCSSNSSSGQSLNCSGKRDSKQKLVSVRIQPTIGPSFTLSLPPSTKIPSLKESISDKMGLSPQKMTLLLHNNALDSGTLTENGIDDGTEVRLVPAIESGVTTTNSVDPVAMMKHSMSGISDQQIDDFLNGKFPLSVAIRVGESVVVVNLHRAKVEEIEVEPPPHKKRCVRSRRPSHHDDVDYLESSTKHSSSRDNYRYLNTNPSSSDLLSARNFSATSAHRSSRRKSHRSLGKGLESRHHHHRSHDHMPSSSAAYPLGQPDRSMLTYTRDVTGAPMETSVAISAPPPMEGHAPIPCATPIISKDAPVVAPMTPPSHHEDAEMKSMENEKRCSGEESMEVSTDTPKATSDTPTADASSVAAFTPQDSTVSTIPLPATTLTMADSLPGGNTTNSCTSDHSSGNKSVSRSVQTDPEPITTTTTSTTTAPPSERREEKREPRIGSRRDNKISSRREVKLPESGISMKRKAVMEAISEILKKMYANTEKGRLPGSFKGRFSSEFTCDSDMREILHSKTTMTSYGSEGEASGKASGESSGAHGAHGEGPHLSKAKLEEQQQLKDKVANLKWQMQHKRAMKMAKRKGERSPCGWMEALNCDMPRGEPKPYGRSGYCGMKRGFLLAD